LLALTLEAALDLFFGTGSSSDEEEEDEEEESELELGGVGAFFFFLSFLVGSGTTTFLDSAFFDLFLSTETFLGGASDESESELDETTTCFFDF